MNWNLSQNFVAGGLLLFAVYLVVTFIKAGREDAN